MYFVNMYVAAAKKMQKTFLNRIERKNRKQSLTVIAFLALSILLASALTFLAFPLLLPGCFMVEFRV